MKKTFAAGLALGLIIGFGAGSELIATADVTPSPQAGAKETPGTFSAGKCSTKGETICSDPWVGTATEQIERD